MKLALLVVGAIACGGPPRPPLAKAGQCDSICDEGAGELAKSSVRLEIGADEPDRSTTRAATAFGGDLYGGDAYGGGMYGGDPYGGTTYAGWAVPQWVYQPPNRVPPYRAATGLTGAIEGVVTWAGPLPGKVQSACGPIDNPSLRVSSDRAVRGALVYIEKVAIGRMPINYGKPAAVGGTVTKRGCQLLPAAQIVTPLPASIAVHGDRQHARVRISDKTYELQEAGMVAVALDKGVTKIDGDDGKLAAAWVLALDTAYFAMTDDAGRFRLDELAAGTYDVTFWQPPIASARPDGTLAYGAPIVVHRTVKVDLAHAARVDVALH